MSFLGKLAGLKGKQSDTKQDDKSPRGDQLAPKVETGPTIKSPRDYRNALMDMYDTKNPMAPQKEEDKSAHEEKKASQEEPKVVPPKKKIVLSSSDEDEADRIKVAKMKHKKRITLSSDEEEDEPKPIVNARRKPSNTVDVPVAIDEIRKQPQDVKEESKSEPIKQEVKEEPEPEKKKPFSIPKNIDPVVLAMESPLPVKTLKKTDPLGKRNKKDESDDDDDNFTLITSKSKIDLKQKVDEKKPTILDTKVEKVVPKRPVAFGTQRVKPVENDIFAPKPTTSSDDVMKLKNDLYLANERIKQEQKRQELLQEEITRHKREITNSAERLKAQSNSHEENIKALEEKFALREKELSNKLEDKFSKEKERLKEVEKDLVSRNDALNRLLNDRDEEITQIKEKTLEIEKEGLNSLSLQKSQMEELKNQISDLEKHVQTVEESKNDLIKEKQNIEKLAVESENTQIQQLKDYVSTLEKERESLKKDHSKQLSDAKQEKERIIADKDQIETDLNKTMMTNSLLRQDSMRLTNKISELEASVKSEKKSFLFVQEQIQQLKLDHENELNRTTLDHMDEIKKIKQEHSQKIKELMDNNADELKKLEQDNNEAINIEVIQLKEEIERKDMIITSNENLLDQKQKYIEELKAEIEQQEQTLYLQKEKILETQEAKKKQEEEKEVELKRIEEQLKQQANMKEQSVKDLQETIALLQQKQKADSQTIASLKELIETEKAGSEKTKTTLKELKKEYRELLQDFDLLEEKLTKYRDDKQELRVIVKGMEQDLKDVEERAAEKALKYDKELKKSKEKENTLLDKITALEDKILDLQRESTNKREVEEMKKKIKQQETDYKAKLDQEQEYIANLEKKIEKFKENQKKLKEELDLMDEREVQLINKYKKREEKLLAELEKAGKK